MRRSLPELRLSSIHDVGVPLRLPRPRETQECFGGSIASSRFEVVEKTVCLDVGCT